MEALRESNKSNLRSKSDEPGAIVREPHRKFRVQETEYQDAPNQNRGEHVDLQEALGTVMYSGPLWRSSRAKVIEILQYDAVPHTNHAQ